jgi:hypothetical protein
MLLNEFLKEHRTVEEQQATNAHQEKEIAALASQLREQAALIREVAIGSNRARRGWLLTKCNKRKEKI